MGQIGIGIPVVNVCALPSGWFLEVDNHIGPFKVLPSNQKNCVLCAFWFYEGAYLDLSPLDYY